MWQLILSLCFTALLVVFLYGIYKGWFVLTGAKKSGAIPSAAGGEDCTPLRQKISELQARVYDLENELAEAKAKIATLQRERDDALAEAEKWKLMYEGAQKDIEDLKNRLARLIAELGATRKHSNAVFVGYATGAAKMDKLRAEREDLRARCGDQGGDDLSCRREGLLSPLAGSLANRAWTLTDR